MQGSSTSNPNWEAVSKSVAASVVSITVSSNSGTAEGSGVVIDSSGHVLTNNHVVSGASNNQVQVTLSNGQLYTAEITGTDTTTDLAVVKLDNPPSDLTVATLGDSDALTVGQAVMAVGNPLGLANTATTGIISALDRPVSASGEDSSASSTVVTNAIQIDAAVNPGNSGGPLFDANGHVVGITSSIATTSSSSGSIGLGFAIPANLAKNISSQLIENGKAEHAYLGVTIEDATATADGVTRRGARVRSVSSNSPASDGGIRTGDVIVAVDDKSVNGAAAVTGYIREYKAGDKVKITIVRGSNAQDLTITLKAGDVSAQPSDGSGSDDGSGNGGSGDDGSGNGGGSDDQGGLDPFDLFGGQ